MGLGGPLEGLWFGVALGEQGLDGSLEFGDALEDAAADLLADDIGERPGAWIITYKRLLS